MKKYNLQNIIKFSKFLNQFEAVERVVHSGDGVRMENDAEHSYKLAMLADYIISSEKLDLDRHKVMMYCLTHDMVETYAGDTYIFSKDAELLASKESREHEALLKIKKEFPEYTELSSWVEKYESRGDEESKFVYVLDKIQPALLIYLGGGKTWHMAGMKFEDLVRLKQDKVRHYPELAGVWEEFLDMLERDKSTLFPG